MASATVAKVISSGSTRRRRLFTAGGGVSADRAAAGLSPAVSRFDLASTSDMTNSAPGEEHHRRKHDRINRQYEERRVPHVAQQTKTGGAPTQSDCDTQAPTNISEIGAT